MDPQKSTTSALLKSQTFPCWSRQSGVTRVRCLAAARRQIRQSTSETPQQSRVLGSDVTIDTRDPPCADGVQWQNESRMQTGRGISKSLPSMNQVKPITNRAVAAGHCCEQRFFLSNFICAGAYWSTEESNRGDEFEHKLAILSQRWPRS
jgi:hypothetical protein